jgi:hypothetical protein
LIISLVELISYSTIFMKYWAGLHGKKDAEDLHAGADGLLRLASASNVGAAPGGFGHTQRPLQIREASVEDTVDDMDLEEQD